VTHARMRLAADQAPDLVTHVNQVLGQVRAILAGDPGDQRASCQRCLRGKPSSRQLTDTGQARDRPAYEWGQTERK
jgi:hypothetical protein